MKKILFVALCSLFAVGGASAQGSQTIGTVTVGVESTRVIGDRLVVSGKFTVNQDTELRNLKVAAITPDGEAQELKGFTFSGKPTSAYSFSERVTAGIPYSYDFYIETLNKDMNPVAALTVQMWEKTANKNIQFTFPNLKVPTQADPNLTPGVVEIAKDVYLKWTKFEESPAGLKIHFTVTNRARRDQEVTFTSYNKAKIIDVDGMAYEGYMTTLTDRQTFPVGVAVAGVMTFEQPIKMSDVLMLQFRSVDINFSIKKLEFVK